VTENALSAPPLPSWSTRWWVIAVFFLLMFAVYGGSLQNLFVRWDDGLLIYENPVIRSITPHSLKTIFSTYDPELYIPLTFLSYQIDYLVGGTSATIYHIQNLVWHTLNALLVAWLMLLLTRRGWLALFCGILFAVHPLHTEAVAWASARKDVLSTCFFLLSIIAYLHFRSDGKKRTYLWSLMAFLLALLAKVTVITLPVLLLLLDFRERRKWNLKMFLEKLPFFLLSGVFAIIAWIGKTGVLTASTPLEKFLMAPVSAMFYLQKIFAPVGLSVLYPFLGEVSLSRTDVLIPFILCIVLIFCAFFSLRWTREILFSLAFYLIAVSPTLFNFSKGDFLYFASDRYAYVPSIGIVFLFAIALARLCDGKLKQLCVGSMCVLLLTLSILSSVQSKVWKDSETLFRNTLRRYPESHVALNNLGNYQRLRGEHAEVIPLLTRALEIARKYARNGSGSKYGESRILTNLASEYRDRGNFTLAEKTAQEAMSSDPTNYHAILGWGVILYQQQKYTEAEQAYRRAIALEPSFATAHINLGALLVEIRKYDEGVAEYRTALGLNPFYPQTHYNLGVILAKLGRVKEAEAAYRDAIRLQPKFTAARLNVGILLYNREAIEESIDQFRAILQYDPTNVQSLSALQQITSSTH